MSFADAAKTKVRRMATELREMSRQVGVMRSVDATETAKWLAEIADALEVACGEGEAPTMSDPAYLSWIRTLPCCVPGGGLPPTGMGTHNPRDSLCFGAIEAHHQTGAGMALKASDHDVMPLCTKHHADFHAHTGRFYAMDKARKRAWQREMVARCQAMAPLSKEAQALIEEARLCEDWSNVF